MEKLDTIEQRKEKAWKVEPKQPEEIFVWCVCDSDGQSCAFGKLPQKITEDDSYQWDTGDSAIEFNDMNLFPKDRPILYRLVPAGQPIIPWRYSVEKETREDEFQARVILSNGYFARRIWFMKGGEWGFHGADKDKILCYCPVDEFPEAE